MVEHFKPKKFGKFVLTKKIAVGGMAEIYKAESYGVDGFKKVAVVKRILPHCSADHDFVTMLIDEAKLSVLLSHTNIVQVYELGKVDDDYYISMEYIHGVNLREILYRCRESGEKVPVDVALFIISEICKGLDYAHRKSDESHKPLNIIHRDVSPQNILISYEGEVKIVDFGIAKAAMNISHTMAGVLKGKIAYMSPEQALGKPLDNKTDMFSAGILLYEILSNTRLFTGESQFEVLKKIRETRIRAQDLTDEIPAELKEIVAKVLAYDREKRYQNTGDLQTDLIRYLYSKYPDFTPRRLSEYISTLFSDLLAAERSEKDTEMDYQSLTSSLSITDGQQVDIVTSPGDDTSLLIPSNASLVDKTPMNTRRKKPKRKHKIFKKIGTLLLLTVVVYGGFKYYPLVKDTFFTKEAEKKEEKVVFTSINLKSSPSGAKIYLDGRNTNLATPTILTDLKVGSSHTIKLELENYRPFEKSIDMASEKPIIFSADLIRITGAIFVTSQPPGANIFINDKDTTLTTPATIEKIPLKEDQKVALKKDGFITYEQIINLNSEKLQPFSTELVKKKPDKAVLVISSTPSGANILINGEKTGKTTPAQITDLDVAKYDVQLELSGFDLWSRSINVSKPDEFDISALLVKPTKVEKPKEEEKIVAESGSIRVTSSPSGAKIYIDGKYSGRSTPSTIKDLSSGSHKIKLEQSGYKTWSRTIEIKPGETISQSGTLTASAPSAPQYTKPTPTPTPTPTQPTYRPTPQPPQKTRTGGTGTVKISSDPSGADVFIGGEYKGKTPLTTNVPAGNTKVIINKEGLQRYSRSVNVESNKTVKLTNIKLGNMYGQVKLTSVPPRASVVFDGRQIPPKTPVTIKKVSKDQPHTITVSLPGYRSWTKTFSITSGDDISLNAFLEKN